MVVNTSSNPGQRGSFEAQPQPVAYDKDGNPLYAQPQQFVHLSRAVEPLKAPISPEIQKLHEESQKKFPRLNLSPAEYILLSVRRHPIGLFKIWAIGLLFILAFMVVYYLTFIGPGASSELADFSGIAVSILTIMIVVITLGVLVATYVYVSNRFYLTNESVIQEIQSSLFSKNEQTVSLSNIEDASYKQDGVLAMMFNYGTIRLSTEGDETTYRFSYVANPKHHIAVLNNAVEAFKNGRPVGMPDPTDD
jgi:hypothetical protein